MELETAIVLMIGVGFLALIGLKALKSYNSTEITKNENDGKVRILQGDHDKQISELKILANQKIHDVQNSRNYYKNLVEHDEFDYDDIESEEDGEFKVSDLAKSIYPKLPPSLANILDKEEFQNAIIKTVEKKPDILNTFIDKFLGKKNSDQEVSNTSNALTETYL